MFVMRSLWTRVPALGVVLAALALSAAMASQAQARVFIGIGVPLFYPPYVAPPPAYYPPSAYYPPYYYGSPGVYVPPDSGFSYAPPTATPPGYAPSRGYAAQSCQAGAYVCPLVQDTPPGGRCSCPGQNGQRIRGQAN
jgi:hypothetical protein